MPDRILTLRVLLQGRIIRRKERAEPEVEVGGGSRVIVTMMGLSIRTVIPMRLRRGVGASTVMIGGLEHEFQYEMTVMEVEMLMTDDTDDLDEIGQYVVLNVRDTCNDLTRHWILFCSEVPVSLDRYSINDVIIENKSAFLFARKFLVLAH
jgi:predicted phosphoadenosine phosphosulfate sulfurtransferase